ncbi:Glycosyltransferase 6-like protein [Drosera capensis]
MYHVPRQKANNKKYRKREDLPLPTTLVSVSHHTTGRSRSTWTDLYTGVFLIRNCQWSMELMDEWATMGPQTPDFEEWGIIQKSILKDKGLLDLRRPSRHYLSVAETGSMDR